jgi:hypothetical protein
VTATLEHPRYQFDRWVAAGGMGEVWQATDTLLDREVAVKVLRPELAQDAILRARFAAEARHAGALQHPRVASVLDYGELAGQGRAPLPFLVMELVDGQPLSALLAAGQPLPPELAAELIAQAADGIEAAHGMGIVHRDVKPGNLLVTGEGQVKVTDFGVARAAHAASLTMTGHLVGTPHYLSPEQAEGQSATAVSDVYSLGVVLYECLTGRKPFAAESPVATALMHIREPLPPFAVPVPERLRQITEVATAKDPSARFRSAGAMAAALRDDSLVTRSYLVPASSGRSAEPALLAPVRRPGRLRPRRLLAGLGALLLASGGVWATTAATDEPLRAPAAEVSANEKSVDIRVRAGDYVGMTVAEATRKLEGLGLRPRVAPGRRSNPGEENAGTVAGVSPTGMLAPGTRVELTLRATPPAPASSTNPAPPGDTMQPGQPGQPGQSGLDAGGRTQDGTAAGRTGGASRPASLQGAQPGDGASGSPGDGHGVVGAGQNNGHGNGNSNAGGGRGSANGNGNAGGNGKGNGGGSAGNGGKR